VQSIELVNLIEFLLFLQSGLGVESEDVREARFLNLEILSEDWSGDWGFDEKTKRLLIPEVH